MADVSLVVARMVDQRVREFLLKQRQQKRLTSPSSNKSPVSPPPK